jgi:hypothetical protein
LEAMEFPDNLITKFCTSSSRGRAPRCNVAVDWPRAMGSIAFKIPWFGFLRVGSPDMGCPTDGWKAWEPPDISNLEAGLAAEDLVANARVTGGVLAESRAT